METIYGIKTLSIVMEEEEESHDPVYPEKKIEKKSFDPVYPEKPIATSPKPEEQDNVKEEESKK